MGAARGLRSPPNVCRPTARSPSCPGPGGVLGYSVNTIFRDFALTGAAPTCTRALPSWVWYCITANFFFNFSKYIFGKKNFYLFYFNFFNFISEKKVKKKSVFPKIEFKKKIPECTKCTKSVLCLLIGTSLAQ